MAQEGAQTTQLAWTPEEQEAAHDTSASNAFTTAQYRIVFGYIRDNLPLLHLVEDPAFLQLFPAARLPPPVQRVLDATLAQSDSVEDFIVRLKHPLLVAL